MAKRFNISMPAFASQNSSKQDPMRCPQPAPARTTTAPLLATQTSSVARREPSQQSPDKATALLAKVASSPSSRRHTPASSPLGSPRDGSPQEDNANAPLPGGEASKREWMASCQRTDGYISFPEFERYRQSCDTNTASNNGVHDRQGIKT